MRGVGAVGRWPAEATATSLAQAGQLSTAGGHRGISGRVGLLTSNHHPEMTTMTDDSIALRGLLEKSADADLLREMIGFAAERLMALEVQA